MKSRAKSLIDEAKKHALEVMHACATPDGFSASAPSHGFHYPEIWARDNGIMTLGTLASGDEDLIAISRNYLKCMAAHQSPLGMIPLNVNTAEHHVNKENAPAVDGNLWYLLAHYALYQACPDPAWLNGCFTSLTKAYQWLVDPSRGEIAGQIGRPVRATGEPAGNWRHSCQACEPPDRTRQAL
jgi:glycogen debranching enzyme